MALDKRIETLSKLGLRLESLINNPSNEIIENLCRRAGAINPWFTKSNIIFALSSIKNMLKYDALHAWAAAYPELGTINTDKTIGAVLAGNIPLVGFHDMLCALISGFRFKGKLSSKDPILLPFLLQQLQEIDAELSKRAELTDSLLQGFDVVIATGSNNTSRYFEQYFAKYPHIIRKNRTSVAVLTGTENADDMQLLADDVFTYFGLGCRNVSKLFVPTGFAPDLFYNASLKYAEVSQHNKYLNNYEYNRTLYLMNGINHFDNGFCILAPNDALGSPIGVIYYQEYESIQSVANHLQQNMDILQCIVSNKNGFYKPAVLYGKTQLPDLADYADDIDTIRFLIEHA